MDMTRKTFIIKNREVIVDDIDLIKMVNGGFIIKFNNGSLVYFKEDMKLNTLKKELIAKGYRNFVPIQQFLVNINNIMEILDNDPNETIVTLIFNKNEENIELNSREELYSLGLKTRDKQSNTL